MKQSLRALIIEDSAMDAELLVRQLSTGGYDTTWQRVDTSVALTAALDGQPWDIIFSDYSMPRFNGTDALALVLKHGGDVPFIFLSGTISEDTAIEAMRAGARDYVTKGNVKRLLPAVDRELREAGQRRERHRAEQEVALLQSITQAASAAPDMTAALAATLSKVCELTHWQLAQAWVPHVDRSTLECSPAWYCEGAGLEKFRTASLSFAFAPNDDLPGRAWSSKRAVWMPNIRETRGYPRGFFANETGLCSALAIPLLADGEVLAVLEFFSRVLRPEETRLTDLLNAVAAQLAGVLQRKRADERLNHLAHHDALTGLPNRVLFVDRLSQAITDADRHKRLVGVAFLDLDRFKTINDSLGHGIGDLLIKATAERLSRCVREGDTVARHAGDEFTLVLADMGHLDHAAFVAKKILSTLAQPFYISGHELFTSASLGMTLYPHDDTGIEGLLRNADIAMYRAKESGGNTYAFYSADMTQQAQARLTLENDLRHALDHDQFELYYQPVVDLGSGHIEAVEALLRWQHPERGMIMPDNFISVSEESGLIVPLSEWVLRRACDQYEQYQRLHPGLRLAVNISARLFQQPDLPEMVLGILRRAKFNPAWLEIEITESVLMQNMESVLASMRKLSAQGVKFSVDDFGTGYSSLAYLQQLPIKRVKIDRSFVTNLSNSKNSDAIVSAIISMAHNLGLSVIAEGVETQEQLQMLRDRGCDAVQGYYYGRPMPAADILKLLQQPN